MRIRDLIVADWVIDLRPVDSLVVSRYRAVWRTNPKAFPPIIVDKKTHEIISGNHRATAARMELGEDADIQVELRVFKDRAEQLVCMAEENSRHGNPMDGITRRRITAAMLCEGLSANDVARIFDVPVNRIEVWGEQSVMVIGKGAQPVKHGIDCATVTKMTAKQYDVHMKRDYGVQARSMVLQVTRWLENGWVNLENEDTVAALEKLRELIAEKVK